jgi:hypothetical protein
MAIEITSKYETLKLRNDDEVKLTLNFARMLWLRSNGYDKEVNMAMRVINGENVDFLEVPIYLYAAYLCALKSDETPAYTQEEFLELCPWDMEIIAHVFARLTTEKKTEVSKMRSSAVNRKAK